eukprot:TRINITY_DN1312_c0_g2_i1.p1 TRINITY_DN1312_c0_g2~~TRINITY_DN1312_c0_g2_i1.p1  ORF type:complete len:300 (+),score=86.20 TRINITY_DN1312_c0_g2_i1:95-994(+)
MSEERILVTGATGGIGQHVVKKLSEAGVSTTVFVRDPAKAEKQFAEYLSKGNIKIAKGDVEDTASFTEAVKGHSRLFLLTTDILRMGEQKEKLGKIAYEAGVKQIVDLSSFTVEYSGSGLISQSHTDGERLLRQLTREKPKERFHVALRPGTFTTNHMRADVHTIKQANTIFGTGHPNTRTVWVDPKDIAEVAASILTDSIEKHGNGVYAIHPDVLSNEERAKVFTKVLGREITYKQVPHQQSYDQLLAHVPSPRLAYDILHLASREFAWATPEICIFTKRPARTLEEWIVENKSAFSK